MSISSTSPWLDDVPPHVAFPPLTEDWQVDVAVVGGGIAGVLTAYTLAKRGVSVALVDKGTIGGGESGYTTGFLTQVVDLSLQDMSRTMGIADAKLVWETGAWAIRQIGDVSREVDVACEFLPCSAFILAADEVGRQRIFPEAERAREFGFQAQWGDGSLPVASQGVLEIQNQGKFHPRKFLTGVAAAITNAGGLVAEKTNVKQLLQGKPHTLVTPNGKITAKQVVICTNFPRLLPELLPQVRLFHTYAIETTLPPQVLPEAIYWDTLQPYHYFRVDRRPDHDRFILGGEDHPADQPASGNPHERLFAWSRRLFPAIPQQVLRQWGGIVIETQDGLPLIGEVGDGIFVATGFSGNGMTFGTISGNLIAGLLLDQQHPWAKLFDPRRFKSI